MSTRPRRFDLFPDDFLAGIAAQLEPVDFAVYWMVNLLIYSKGGPIPADLDRIAGLFKKTRPVTIARSLQRLHEKGKIDYQGATVASARAQQEISKASARQQHAIANGLNGGRPVDNSETSHNPTVLDAHKLPYHSIPYQEETLSTNANNGADHDTEPPPIPQANLFDPFWAVYPKHVGKGAAKRAFPTALKKTDIDTIMAAVRTFARSCDGMEPRYIPHASTWLNGERWTDEPQKPPATRELKPWQTL